MVTETRLHAGDRNSTKFTDTVIINWIDRATDHIISLLSFDSAMATMSTVEGEPNYSMANIGSSGLKEVYVTGDDGKEYRFEVYEQDQMNSLYGIGWRSDANGRPQVAYKADYNVLGLYPEPNANNANRTIRIFYNRQSSALASDTDTPIYLPMLHMANVHWAAAQGKSGLGDMGGYRDHMGEFERYFKKAWHSANTFSEEQWRWSWG